MKPTQEMKTENKSANESKTLLATNGQTGEDRIELWDGPRGKSIFMPGGSWLYEGQIGFAEALEYCYVEEK